MKVIKLINILREVLSDAASLHATQRFNTRFTQDIMSQDEKNELKRRFDKANMHASQFKQAAIMLLSFDRMIYFHPGSDESVYFTSRESNGDVIWVVIRNGKIVTIFARRSDQRFGYWEDPTRGNIPKENIYYMSNDLQIKRLKYQETWEKTSDVIKRLPDFMHKYKPQNINN